ncbi:MAG TPA: proton-conducting transporter membrane subunit, partial [Geminicoccaceae bacterium]|nr:proton-conducting transporter membrane subunit [Geminicoccaceae bacterium]
RADFATPPGTAEARAPLAFWTLLLGVWAAMNAVLLGDDLFNLFVALELLTFSAVPLVCLDGRAETLRAALRYLLFALLGSVLYLLGVALLYGAYGTLDILLLAALVRPSPATLAAASLMTAGLLAKTALFPLHLWLPPAHAGAPAPASAVLSSLVVKGSFLVIVRLWFDVMPALSSQAAMQILAALGAAAILFGSVLALRQARLKLLIAYSTVAQIGYLFLMFPLAASAAAQAGAWTGGVLQAISHACAKAAMFMAAGLIAQAAGHDRIAGLAGIGRALPVTVLAFGLGGLSLMGLPPSGGFMAKWLLLRASIDAGQWWWGLVVVAGGLLTGGYVFRVLEPALAESGRARIAPVAHEGEMVALALAVLSMALGLVPFASLGLLQIGRLPAALAP